jgi:hypothetical protein
MPIHRSEAPGRKRSLGEDLLALKIGASVVLYFRTLPRPQQRYADGGKCECYKSANRQMRLIGPYKTLADRSHARPALASYCRPETCSAAFDVVFASAPAVTRALLALWTSMRRKATQARATHAVARANESTLSINFKTALQRASAVSQYPGALRAT